MEQSILKSTKKILGVGDDDPSFDLDIITHINAAFSDLHDIGVGPVEGFVIEDDTIAWTTYLTDKVQLSRAKTVVFFKTRLAFDPPASSYHLTAMQEGLKEAMWRLNTNREATEWVDPDPTVDPEADPVVVPPVLDGGDL
jgi:hypothetical protein